MNEVQKFANPEVRACSNPVPSGIRPALSRASKPHDPMILLLICNFVKVARGSSLRTKVQLIIWCGLYMDKDEKLPTPRRVVYNQTFTVKYSTRIAGEQAVLLSGQQ
ncbi:hypothetical protein TURU_052382 [Turdus rufiventris]|nr:hypothetical protein TURU_052382 [Turdus rufiventris]